MCIADDRDGVAFANPDGEDTRRDSIAANEGRTRQADDKGGDGFGFVADGIEGGQHIAVLLTGGKRGKGGIGRPRPGIRPSPWAQMAGAFAVVSRRAATSYGRRTARWSDSSS